MNDEIFESWPFNLALDIFNGDKDTALNIYIPGMDEALSALTDREKMFVSMRYTSKMTLSEIGKVYNLTTERVRQIIAKAVRKLKHPIRRRAFIAVSEKSFHEISNKLVKLEAEYRELQDAFESFGLNLEEAKYKIDGEDIDIEEMDLSVRSYNCLKRAGIRTAADIAKLSYEQLCSIRNLGKRSVEEIERKMNELGLSHRNTGGIDNE